MSMTLRPPTAAPDADPIAGVGPDPGDLDYPRSPAARAGRRTFRAKFAAGLRGLKYALRGDSSFFAHGYRGLLIALTAAMLGVGPFGWCLLVMAAALVLMAEMTHSAVDTLARAVGDPDEPGLAMAREIATGGVLVAATISATVCIVVLLLKLNEMMNWWR